MRAVVCTRYGPPEVLQLREVQKPVPKDDEVLVWIRATTVIAGDVLLRRFRFPLMYRIPMGIVMGFTKPRRPILGIELAGEVQAAGRNVKRFKKGDRVFGSAGMKLGAHAEYICLPETAVLAPVPDRMAFEEAAALPVGAATALYFLRKGGIREGQEVLVYGASGSVGTYAVQLARHFGAKVTGVCSTANLDLAASLGAKRVIDYTKEDFTQGGGQYDIVFDTVGKTPFSATLRTLRPGGAYLLCAVWDASLYLRGMWASLTGSRKVRFGMSNENLEDLLFIRGLAEAGKIRPVVDRSYPLEAIAEAHRYVETGRKKGNVVITVS